MRCSTLAHTLHPLHFSFLLISPIPLLHLNPDFWQPVHVYRRPTFPRRWGSEWAHGLLTVMQSSLYIAAALCKFSYFSFNSFLLFSPIFILKIFFRCSRSVCIFYQACRLQWRCSRPMGVRRHWWWHTRTLHVKGIFLVATKLAQHAEGICIWMVAGHANKWITIFGADVAADACVQLNFKGATEMESEMIIIKGKISWWRWAVLCWRARRNNAADYLWN